MRELALRVALALAVLASASSAKAAPIEIVVTLQPGTTNWVLELRSSLPVGALTLAVPEAFGGFIPVIPPPPMPCVCLPLDPLDGFKPFDFARGAIGTALPPLGSGVLGQFPSLVTSGVQVLPGEHVFSNGVSFFDGTAYDLQFTPYDASQYEIRVVPEAGVSGLALLAVLAPVSLRRSRTRSATRT